MNKRRTASRMMFFIGALAIGLLFLSWDGDAGNETKKEAALRDEASMKSLPPGTLEEIQRIMKNAYHKIYDGDSPNVVYTSAPNKSIPDNNPAGVLDTLSIPATDIGFIALRLDTVLHTYVGDLRMTLTAPNGDTVVLMNRPGTGTFGSGGDNFIATVLTDTAARPIDSIVTAGAPYTGYYRPDSALARVRVNMAAGNWILKVTDNEAADSGKVVQWSIIVEPATPPPPPWNDPAVLTAMNASGTITVNGAMDEADWSLAAPYLVFGPNARTTAATKSVTGGAEVRPSYTDTSWATIKMLRKGLRLYLGIQSSDKSVGRFGDSWEGDGLFMKIKNSAGTDGEFKLYYNASDRTGASADSAVYEPGGPFRSGFGNGVGLVNAGTVPYDTTQVDAGYTLELEVRLDSLGFASGVDTLQVLMNIFDPDGYHRGTQPWVGPPTRTFHKTWWGSEWGPLMRKIYLQPARAYDDPAVLTAKAALNNIVVDGRMDESDWAGATPYLKFGPNPSTTSGERSVTGGALVRGTYWDPSYATMKFLRRGQRLYVGIQSSDKSVGTFGDSWEGDGLFMKIANAAGTQGEFKLYYNSPTRTGATADSAVYEPGGPFRAGFGFGVGLVAAGTVPYDTTQTDNGYTLELEIRLDSLGFATTVDTLTGLFNVFDPDGYHRGSVPWVGPETRVFHKTWWGSEWGPVARKIYLEPQRAYDDPAVMTAKATLGTINVDGKMDEPEWTLAKPYLKFGPMPVVTADERSVTGGALVRGTYDDPSFATIKLLRKGPRLYLGIQSADRSVGRFGDSWEGDGLFMKIQNSAGTEGEFKLYYNASDRTGASRDSAVYEPGGPFRATFGNGVGLVASGTIPYDTTQVDSGYTLELEVRLDSLGFAASVDTLRVLMNIFDADGYHRGTQPWVGPPSRAFHKTWWGTEWGPANRKIYLEPQRPYDDPARLTANLASGTINIDGKMDEAAWALAKPYLKFGPNPPVSADERSVTNGALVRGVYWDPTFATVKFLRNGLKLYIGIDSRDKSVGRFGDSWEGDGLFMKIKNAAGADNGEFKLYYNASDRTGASKDSAVYEIGGPFRPGFARGIGLVRTGTIPYDTTQVDSGYTLELQINLDSLGYGANVDSVELMMNIFDPDGYHRGSVPWVGPPTRSFHKTWWGSEWGPAMRWLRLGRTVDVAAADGIPTEFALSQNYPNPFNPTTTIKFDVPEQAHVTLVVYDVIGREVTTLVNSDLAPGYQRATFSASSLASGVYFYRMTSLGVSGKSFVQTKKLLLMK